MSVVRKATVIFGQTFGRPQLLLTASVTEASAGEIRIIAK